MAILTLNNVHFSVGTQAILDGVNLSVEAGERLCLIGRNGEGKSTLLRIVTGEQMADDGEVRLQPGRRMAWVSQEPHLEGDGSVYDTVASGLGNVGHLLGQYHEISQLLTTDYSDEVMARLEKTQQAIESQDGWSLGQRVDKIITRLELPADAKISSLSGGWKRRVALGRALVQEPDLLLLDEPTNHLDIEAIAWLEEFVSGYQGALIFITHDRTFLQNLATRIIELDRGQLTSWPGDYENYLRRKEEREAEEAIHNAHFDKKLAQEEVWIRQGIKARRTRNEGRVRALKVMREERGERVGKQGKVALAVDKGQQSGKIVVEVEGVNKAYEGRPIIKDFSCTVMRGDRIGLLGPNGAGKSTLLRIFLGQEAPDAGRVKVGTKLEVAYFDQYREQLDDDKSAIENVAEGSDTIEINGRSTHIISYLGKFLFSPVRARSTVKMLSGGERNRLLLAKIFSKPANVLVLDEPTNDLDIETLEILENLLLDYQGTLLLVSHDRTFMNNVVTSTLAFEGGGVVKEYVGGYDDWLKQRQLAGGDGKGDKGRKDRPGSKKDGNQSGGKGCIETRSSAQPKKLSYKDQRELDELPKRIEALEAEQAELEEQLADPALYQGKPGEAEPLLKRAEALGEELEQAYARWEALEG
ncbi:MAG: ATP-binding cassette domain-containing protein [bacterium]